MIELVIHRPQLGDLAQLKSALNELIADKKHFRRVYLACEEVFVNIVSYSGAESLRIAIVEKGNLLTVAFSDDGRSFDPLEYEDEKAFDDLDNGGMGLSMVCEIADGMRYDRENDNNVLELTFRRQGDA